MIRQSRQFFADLPFILQTLRQLKDDPACYGLLKKLSQATNIGTIYILGAVLPILTSLSKCFQQCSITYARVSPAIDACKGHLQDLLSNNAPRTQISEALKEGGTLFRTETTATESDITFLKKLLHEYVSALSENITSSPVLSSMQIFNPRLLPHKTSSNFKDYGENYVQVLAEHYVPDISDQEQVHAAWNTFKYDLLTWKMTDTEKQSPEEFLLHRLLAN